MTQTSYPFDAQDVTEDQYRLLMREMVETGVVGSVGDTDLEIYGDSSGMNVKARAGSAIVEGYFYDNSVEETLTVTAAHATLPRVDTAILRLSLPLNSCVLAVKAGTPATAGSQVPPALSWGASSVWEFPLADIAVGAGVVSVSAVNVTNRRVFSGWGWTTANRPTTSRKYRPGYNVTTAQWEFYDGTSWVNLGKGIKFSSLMIPTSRTDLLAGTLPYATLDGRQLYASASDPTSTDGLNGDWWAKY